MNKRDTSNKKKYRLIVSLIVILLMMIVGILVLLSASPMESKIPKEIAISKNKTDSHRF